MTCAAGDFDCRLDAITTALNAGPDGWAIAAVIIAGIGVLASTAVAIVAYTASARAVAIAEKSDSRENVRDERQDRDRVDRWLAEFIVEATSYAEACDLWVRFSSDQLDEHVSAGYTGDPDELPQEPEPQSGRMIALLDAARLVAQPRDRQPLIDVATILEQIPLVRIFDRPDSVRGLVDEVRAWRTDDRTTVDVERLRRSLRP